MLVVGDTHSTIQEAIDAAQYGEPVLVPAGDYEENLELAFGTHLIGEQIGAVQIAPRDLRKPVLSGEGIWPAVVDGLDFIGPGPKRALGAELDGCAVKLVNCAFVGFRNAIVVHQAFLSEVGGCEFSEVVTAISAIESSVWFHHNRLWDFAGQALCLYGSDGLYEFNSLGPGGGGYLALNACQPVLRNNGFYRLGRHAGLSDDGAQPIVRNCWFARSNHGLIVGESGGLINSHNGFFELKRHPIAFGTFREDREPTVRAAPELQGPGTVLDDPVFLDAEHFRISDRSPYWQAGIATAIPRRAALSPADAVDPADTDLVDSLDPQLVRLPIGPVRAGDLLPGRPFVGSVRRAPGVSLGPDEDDIERGTVLFAVGQTGIGNFLTVYNETFNTNLLARDEEALQVLGRTVVRQELVDPDTNETITLNWAVEQFWQEAEATGRKGVYDPPGSEASLSWRRLVRRVNPVGLFSGRHRRSAGS